MAIIGFSAFTMSSGNFFSQEVSRRVTFVRTDAALAVLLGVSPVMAGTT